MTEEQCAYALALCGHILETAAKLQADLRAAQAVIEEMEDVLPPSGHSGLAVSQHPE